MEIANQITIIEPTTEVMVGAKILQTVSLFSTLLVLGILIIIVVSLWKIFKKAGESGWKSIIPIYNEVILFKIIGISPWWLLGYLLGFIPVVGSLIAVALTICMYAGIAKAFGKGLGFTIGLILLTPIFMAILAFGKDEYQLDTV